mmetsp:Transcript_41208/g.78965  ORF Transcript_41208/g.78965 Transcript_41208/m.78965 type:complete len:128 (+) Transcript_41208:16-399(+)
MLCGTGWTPSTSFALRIRCSPFTWPSLKLRMTHGSRQSLSANCWSLDRWMTVPVRADCKDDALLEAAATLPGLELGAGWTGNLHDIVRIELRHESQQHLLPRRPQLYFLVPCKTRIFQGPVDTNAQL